MNRWDELWLQVKIFIKGDPTKKSKLAKGMPRVVGGMPTDVTTKHACVFRQLANALVRHWKKTPVKYAFAPANPGHIEHLQSVLPGAVWESDKSTWDYTMSGWMSTVCCMVVKMLAIRHPDWTEEEYQLYLQDVENCFKQVFECLSTEHPMVPSLRCRFRAS